MNDMNLNLKQGKWNTIIVYTLLSLISSVYVYFILLNANWTWGDDYEFLISTAVGKIEWSLHIANRGRFYPFGHFDYNILTLIPGATTPLAHYILVALSFVFFLIFSIKLYSIILKETGRNSVFNTWLILIIISFLLYYFYRIFLFLVYPERMIVVLMTLYFILYYQFIKKEKMIYGVIAIIISVYLIYCKETIFLVFSTIFGLNLLFNFKNLTNKQKIFYYALGLNVIIFLLLYYFIAYRNAETFYSRNSNLNDVFLFSIGNLKLLYIAVVLALWRAYQVLIKKDRQHLFFDSLLFSGIIYALANVLLKLPMDYYYFPAVMMTLPAIIYWLTKYLHPKWICIGLLVISVYYGRKFPTVIKSVQGQRINTSMNVVGLTKFVKSASEVLWYDDPTNNIVEQGLIGYQREISEIYMKFYDQSLSELKIRHIDSISESIMQGAILLYSDKNNTSQNISELGFEKIDLPNIHEISVYKKK